MAGKIFINYRRDDSMGTAGRLHDRLAQSFGRGNLFMDVDNIPAGVDFVDYLHNQVGACDIFLAVIGPHWLDAKDERGRRRLDNPDDFVAVEIAAALSRNIRVIPVMLDGARMPAADDLPEPIKQLVRRNAVEVRHNQFGRDAEALVAKVREALKRPPRALPSRRVWVPAAAVALLLLFAIGLYQLPIGSWVNRSAPSDSRNADSPKAQAELTPVPTPGPHPSDEQRTADDLARQAKAAGEEQEKRQALLDQTLRNVAAQRQEMMKNATNNLQGRSPVKVLGLELADMSDDLRKRYKIKAGLKGVVVTSVDAGSQAFLEISPGYVIVEANQQPVASTADFQAKVDKLNKDGEGLLLLKVADANGLLRDAMLFLNLGSSPTLPAVRNIR